MNRVIYFDNENQKRDRCEGNIYRKFLDYAFDRTDFFMLVYVNYQGKGYSKKMKLFQTALRPYQVKIRRNPSWPGVLNTFSPQTTYKIIFYKNNPKAKDILKEVDRLSAWSSPSYPQDLAFFDGNECWFYSVGHEKIGAVIHATKADIDFVSSNSLAQSSAAYIPHNNYFDKYNEDLV